MRVKITLACTECKQRNYNTFKNKKNDPDRNENKEKKTGRFGQFFKEVSGEVKKLSWPTKKEIVSYTLTVIAFILLMAVVIYALDLVFGEGLGLLASL